MTAARDPRWPLLLPLCDPAVRRLAAARFAALLGSSLLPTALAFAVLGMTDTSASTLGAVVAAAVGGQVLALLPGGVVADRTSRRRLMTAAELAAGAATLVMGTLVLLGHATVLQLAILAAGGGAATGFFYPAFTGFVPEVAAPEQLQSVNALLRFSVNVARILGAALSGVLVASLGAGVAITGSGLASVTAAALIAWVPPRHSVPRAAASRPLGDFREGWREFRSRRWVVVIVILGAVSNLGVGAALGVLGPLQSKASLGGATAWATISSALALGTVLGAFVAVRIRVHRPLVVAMPALGLFALPLAALAVPTSMLVIAGSAFVAGVALDVFSVLWDTSLQRYVPHEALSRVSAFDWLGSFALSPLALVAAGPLVDAFGIAPVLWVAAGLAAMPPLALLEAQVRQLGARRGSSER
nr:MFS transporter [Kineosporia sp. A_224]